MIHDANKNWTRKISKLLFSKNISRLKSISHLQLKLKQYKNFYPIFIRSVLKISEKHEIKLLKSILKPGMRVLDIGANMGLYTEITSKIVRDKGHVFAFEPEPYNFEILSKLISSKKLSNVTPLQLALSNKPGEMKLYIDDVNPGNHSFAQTNLYLGSNHYEVQTKTLDELKSVIGKIDFIKIDVQGAEGLVFEGAKQFLEDNKKISILLEYWPSGLEHMQTDHLKFIEQFYKKGFKVWVLNKGTKPESASFKDIQDLVKSWDSESDYSNLLLERL